MFIKLTKDMDGSDVYINIKTLIALNDTINYAGDRITVVDLMGSSYEVRETYDEIVKKIDEAKKP